MPNLRNNFLLVGPWDSSYQEIGAQIIDPNHYHLFDFTKVHVLGASITLFLNSKFAQKVLDALEASPRLQVVVVAPLEYPLKELLHLQNQFSFFSILQTFSFSEGESSIYRALEKAQIIHQDYETERLLLERQKELELKRTSLELDVEKRTRLFAESRHNLHQRSHRLEILRKALEIIRNANSLADIETQLSQILASSVDVSWIRILQAPQDEDFAKQMKNMNSITHQRFTIGWNSTVHGSVFFMRPIQQNFRREIILFLEKISDAIGLALNRLQQQTTTESLKKQWQLTFEAVSDGIALIRKNYEIVQSNRPNAEGKKCYEVFFNKSSPCENCKRGQTFQLEKNNRHWQVQSQYRKLESESEDIYIHRYVEITETLDFEKRSLDLARKVELGTIGSSLAHELNNPLGGILNFAQLMQMELPKEHPIREDIQEIERGARRCKDIVETLLTFTRTPRPEDIRLINLTDVIQKTLLIHEPRLRSLSIESRFQIPDEDTDVMGSFGLLVQALSGLQVQSIDRIVLSQKNNPTQKGLLEWKINFEKSNLLLSLYDNSELEEAAESPHWTEKTSRQVLLETGAHLEFFSNKGPGLRAKVSFPRPVKS